ESRALYLLNQAQPVVNRNGDKAARDFENVEAHIAALLDITIHDLRSLRKHMLNEAAGGDQYIVAMGKIDDFSKLLLRHQCERTAREFQRVYIFAHRLQHILQVTFAHGSIVGAADLGDTARAGFALALVHTNKWKCSFAHTIPSLSPFNRFVHFLHPITRSTALHPSIPGEPLFLQ